MSECQESWDCKETAHRAYTVPLTCHVTVAIKVQLADVSRHPNGRKPLTTFGAVPRRMPNSLTESSLYFHQLCTEFRLSRMRQESRVETWITSLTSTRSAAGRKGQSSVTRSRATSASSASSIAYTLATICTDAGSQVSESYSRKCSGLEEEDEERGNPSQDRNILGKRARKVAEARGQTLVHCIFILILYFSFSQELKSPVAFPLLPRSPALKIVRARQSPPIHTHLVRRMKALYGEIVKMNPRTRKPWIVNIALYS